MHPQSVQYAGYLQNNAYYPNNSTSDTVLSISGQKVVECSAVVPGNRHTPNAWWFRVFSQHGPHGSWEAKSADRIVNGEPVWTYYTSQGDLWDSLNGRMPQPGASLASLVYNKALTKLYNQIRQSDLNLAVSVGEARETYQMIKAVVDGAIHAKRSIRRLIRRNGIAGASRKLSSAWLGYAYGIRPLASDVSAMLEHVASNPSVLDVTTKARASDQITETSLIDDFSTGRKNCVRQVVSDSRRCLVGVTWAPSSYGLNELSRITSLFPPTLLWELTTLSFVADWFVDVGSYLANLEASFGTGLTFKHGYVTQSRRVQLNQTCSWSQDSTSWNRTTTLSNWTRVAEEKASDRVLLTYFPRPELPTLDIQLGSEQLLSLASLLRTIGLKKY